MRIDVDPRQALSSTHEWHAVFSPIIRAVQLPTESKIPGLVLGLVTQLFGHVGVMAWVGMVIIAIIDYRIGRSLALARGTFRPDLAQLGKIGKISGIALVGFILGAELWMGANDILVTKGLVSACLGGWLIVDDLRSIIRHRVEAGGSVPPWLEPLLKLSQETISSRAVRALHNAPQENRDV